MWVTTSLSADSLDWNVAEEIPPGASSGVGSTAITINPGPNAGNAIATWADVDTYAPYYSIYDNGTWTTGAISLEASGSVLNNIYTALGPNSNDVMAAWNDRSTGYPYYSIYDGISWATGTITLGPSNGCNYDVVLAVGPNNGEVTAAWANDSAPNNPYYSIYSSGTWTTGAIPVGSSNGVYLDVFISQGPSSETLMATWTDSDNLEAYYSIYSGGAWATPSTIPLGTSTSIYTNVYVAQGPNSGEMVAVWPDGDTDAPFYSIYNGGTWTTGSIPLGSSIGVWGSIHVTQGPSTGQLVATWKDLSSHVPYYSLYSSGSWGDGAPIPLGTSTGSSQDVYVGLLLDASTAIAAWGNLAFPYVPYFTTVVGQPDQLPPTNGKGNRVKNRFALLLEWYNELNWTASVSSGVVGYNIRRNGSLIAEGIKQLFYMDYNRPKNGVDTYQISSLFEDGTESSTSLEITVD